MVNSGFLPKLIWKKKPLPGIDIDPGSGLLKEDLIVIGF